MKHAGWIVAAAVVLLALTQGRQTAGPMQPTAVGITMYHEAGGNSWYMYRLWSDGAIDRVRHESQQGQPDCNAEVLCVIPGTCPGDITHDGAVATADLLGVLETWGPCE